MNPFRSAKRREWAGWPVWRSGAAFWLALSTTGLFACRFDSAVPANIVVLCTSDDDCPPARRCHPLQRVCVLDTNGANGPVLEATETLPSQAAYAAGTRIVIRFRSNKPLARLPKIRGNWGQEVPAEFLVERTANGEYEASWTILDGLGSISIDVIAAEILGRDGTASNDTRLTTLTLDTSSPEIIVDTPTPAYFTLNQPVPALGRFGQVRFSFRTSEALKAEPQIRCSVEAASIVFACTSLERTNWSCQGTLPASVATVGVCQAEIVVTDQAGNQGTAEFPTAIRIDSLPPPPPPVGEGGLRLLRSPADDVEDRPVTRVVGTVPSQAEAAWLRVSDVAPSSNAAPRPFLLEQVLAEGTATSVELAAHGTDIRAAWAWAVDACGNESEARKIRLAHWVGIPSEFSPAPFVVEKQAIDRDVLWQPPTGQISNSELTALRSDEGDTVNSVVIATGGAAWERRGGGLPVWDVHVASDPNSGRAFVIGGRNALGCGWSKESWEWNGTDWVSIPRPAGDIQLAFLEHSTAVWPSSTIGGIGTPYAFGYSQVSQERPQATLWELAWEVSPDTARNRVGRWRRRAAAPAGDIGVARGAMVMDTMAERLIVFGGTTTAGSTTNAMWEWDRSHDQWNRVALLPQSSAPPPRNSFGMVYNPLKGSIVVYGGTNGTSTFDDTWIFERAAEGNRWRQVATEYRPLRGASSGLLYFDYTRGSVLLATSQSIWELKDDIWVATTSPAPQQPAKLNAKCIDLVDPTEIAPPTTPVLFQDPARKRTLSLHSVLKVAVGEYPVGSRVDELREGGGVWTQNALSHATLPTARAGHAMAGSPAGVMIFGGALPGDSDPSVDTWVWSKTGVDQRGGLPGAGRYDAALTWDSLNSEWALWGGLDRLGQLLGEYHTMQRIGTFWTRGSVTGLTSADVRTASSVLLSTTNGILLAGGRVPASAASSSSYLITGSATAGRTAGGPTSMLPRSAGCGYYSRNQVGTVLFGRDTSTTLPTSAIEWTFNPLDGNPNGSWKKVDVVPAAGGNRTLPPGRIYPSCAYNELRDEVVIAGGFGDARLCGSVATVDPVVCQPFRDLWLYRSPQMSPLEDIAIDPLDGAPEPRGRAGMAWDETRQSIVLFGGHVPSTELNGRWRYLNDAWELVQGRIRPAILVHFSPQALGGVNTDSIRSLEIETTVGGTGETNRMPTHGVQMFVWTRKQWRSSGVTIPNSVDQISGPRVRFVLTPQELADAWADDGLLHLKFVPLGRNERATARIVMNSLRITTSYELP